MDQLEAMRESDPESPDQADLSDEPADMGCHPAVDSEIDSEVDSDNDRVYCEDGEHKEDIYGRPLQTKETSSSAYVAPHRRGPGVSVAAASSVQSVPALPQTVQSRVKGLINRLSEANLPAIAKEFQSLFEQHSTKGTLARRSAGLTLSQR